MRKFIKWSVGTVVFLYIAACMFMYLKQESFIFLPDRISANQQLTFCKPSKELNFKVDGAVLSGVLFQVKNPKGLVFFVHGNKGNVLNQEKHMKFYNDLGYDFFTFDYRSFGKSTGENANEDQFFQDAQLVYKTMMKQYKESETIVIGYSLGTASAAMLAAKNRPAKLALIAPYFSLKRMTIHRYKVIPTFLVKYPFETNVHLAKVKAPVLLVHGDKDKVLPFSGSLDLKKLLKKKDQFLPLKGQGHDDLEKNPLFCKTMTNFLYKNQ